MPPWGAHLEGEVTPEKSANTPRNGDPPQTQVTPQEMRVVQAMVHPFSSPPASTEKVGAQEPGPKRQKTPSGTPKEGRSPALAAAPVEGMLDLSLIGVDGKEEFHDAGVAPIRMEVEGEGDQN